MQVKICGLRTPHHAQVAAACGATHLGFIFAESKRRVTPAEAQRAVRAARQIRRPVQCVGVFVNEPPAQIRAVVAECGLDVVQLSGDEPVDALAELDGVAVIKTVRLAGAAHEAAWLMSDPARVLLHVDAHVAGSYGGAGVTGDWQAAARLAAQRPILLAGGLNPANVAAAIAAVRPWGVDVSSGVERAGHKHSTEIAAFVRFASHADA